MGSEPELNRALIQAARAHRNAAAHLLADFGLHPGQEIVLFALWERDHRTQVDLARTLRIEQGTITKILRRMEEAGFVERRTSTVDRRAQQVSLTPRGRRLRPRVEAAWAELEATSVAGMTARERAQLERLLEKVATNLRPVEGGGDTSCRAVGPPPANDASC